MKISFLVYHDILEDRVVKLLNELKIDTYSEWENVKGKLFHDAEPHLGTRSFPGHDIIRLIPFEGEEKLNNLISSIHDFNKEAQKKEDEIRLFLLPLERIV